MRKKETHRPTLSASKVFNSEATGTRKSMSKGERVSTASIVGQSRNCNSLGFASSERTERLKPRGLSKTQWRAMGLNRLWETRADFKVVNPQGFHIPIVNLEGEVKF